MPVGSAVRAGAGSNPPPLLPATVQTPRAQRPEPRGKGALGVNMWLACRGLSSCLLALLAPSLLPVQVGRELLSPAVLSPFSSWSPNSYPALEMPVLSQLSASSTVHGATRGHSLTGSLPLTTEKGCQRPPIRSVEPCLTLSQGLHSYANTAGQVAKCRGTPRLRHTPDKHQHIRGDTQRGRHHRTSWRGLGLGPQIPAIAWAVLVTATRFYLCPFWGRGVICVGVSSGKFDLRVPKAERANITPQSLSRGALECLSPREVAPSKPPGLA